MVNPALVSWINSRQLRPLTDLSSLGLPQLRQGQLQFYLQKEVPMVHFRAVVPAGVRQDSKEQAGLSELTANLLSSGTASYDKETIETTLDFMGASNNSSSNMEAAVLTSSFINKDLPLVLPILMEMLAKPSFEEAEFVKQIITIVILIKL